jgi:ubiquinone/menaquinone biosynthesis C-methylase UbiE
MNSYAKSINSHYVETGLAARILAALERAGKNLDAMTRDDVASFDEFHIRGLEATREMARLARLEEGTEVLDLGSGLGGPARTLADEFGCVVTGIDLAEEYCQTARMLSGKLGDNGRVTFRQGDILDMPFDDGSFDVVWLQHVAMNIEDKGRLFDQIRRVLRPKGRLGFYEICAGSVTPIHFPVPWASDPSINFLVEPGDVRRMLSVAGFWMLEWRDVTAPALEWFQDKAASAAQRPPDAPPLLGLNLIMGGITREKVANTARNLAEDRIRVLQGVLELAV